MRILADARTGINLIRACADGTLTVNESAFRTSIALSAETLTQLPTLRAASQLSDDHALMILETDPEVVIVGTGLRQHFPQAEWSAKFLTKSVGVEVMTTAAACRTYNVLATEHRRVTALLILGDAPCEKPQGAKEL